MDQAQSGSESQAKRLRFDRYLLDLDRGCLLLDGGEINLRPKTFAILEYLTKNPGRLVSKDELFGAVWPNLAVTDDVLVQSIGELRRALGEDGSRLIKTIPRRGYRLDCSVSPSAAVAWAEEEVRPHTGDALAHAAAVRAGFGRNARIGGLALLLVALAAVGTLVAGPDSVGRFAGLSALRAGHAAKPAIAILPFVNETEDASRQYFADGLTQDVIASLGRFSEITVLSWNAVLPYKSKSATPGEVAKSLSARYQVEGSVRQTGDRVRVVVQLVDADGRVLWSARLDEALADLFALQDEITTETARALAIHISRTEQRRAIAKPTDSLEAYDYVLRARPALQHPQRSSAAEARAWLRRAIELDPNYAAAYAALAESYYNDVSMGWAESPTESMGRAEQMAVRALTLDDSEVRAHIVLGRVHIFRQQYEEARTDMDRAIAVNPNDARAIAGRGNALMWIGRTDEAIEALELAQHIDPDLNALDCFALSLAYYLKGRYGPSIAQAELNLTKTEAARFSQIVLAAAYAQQDRGDEAARIVSTIRSTDPMFDPQSFGSKFLRPGDLEKLRDGFRKAGLYAADR